MHVKYIVTLLSVALLGLQCSMPLTAQESSTQYGVGGILYGGIDQHNAPIKGLPGVPSCCPEYSTATAFMPALDLMGHIRLGSSLRGEARLGFDYHSSTLKAETQQVIAPNGIDELVTIDHQLTTARSYLSITSLLGYDVTRRLSVLGGVRFGMLMGSSFSQQEALVSPADVTYEDGNRTRFARDSSAVPDASSTKLSAMIGLRYDIPVTEDEHWHIMPELTAQYGLGNIQQSQPWTQNSVRLGVAVVWQNYKQPDPPPPPPPAPVIKDNRDSILAAHRDSLEAARKDSLLAAKKQAEEEARKAAARKRTYAFEVKGASSRMLDDGGNPVSSPKFTVNNLISLNLYALLNYVFFDSASAVIPERYHRLTPEQTRSYKLDALNGQGTFAIYHDLLNIVGLKLRNSPGEKIVVTGCNADAGAERNNRELSRARANAVREYLTQVWGIESSRIEMQSRDLPENPSSSNVPDGVTENRRVEITGPDNRILDPIFFTDTIRTVNASTIAITPEIQADTAIATWSVNITQGARVLEKITGKGKPPTPIQWNLKGRSEVYPHSKDPLRFDVDIVDATGQRQVVQAPSMQVEQLYRSDKKTEKFSMIIFGFNESEFTKQHERILDIIRPRIYPNSKVTVEGYTDRLGTEDYNLRLSQRRAREVASRLNVKRDNAVGYGSANSLFDNNTPEGRLYSRTVLITIETPVE